MKNKKLIIFLCLILLVNSILPIKTAEAGTSDDSNNVLFTIGCTIFTIVTAGLGAIPCTLAGVFGGETIGAWASDAIAKIIAVIIKFLTFLSHKLLFWINTGVVAKIINNIAMLNPFQDDISYTTPEGKTIPNIPSPIKVLWNILKNFAYIILVFSALAAGFEWLMGQESDAKRLIFNIIIVALLINFSFVLVKETFSVVKAFEDGLTGGESGKIGTLMAYSLWQKDPFDKIDELTAQFYTLKEEEKVDKEAAIDLMRAIAYLFIVVLDMIIFISLFVTAVLFIARYIMMIFLAGVSPIAFVSLTIPEFQKIKALAETFSSFKFFNKWLSYFVRYLLVVPIFVILVIMGNVLTNNTLGQAQGILPSYSLQQFAEFMILLSVLTGWYIISLITARKMANEVAKLGEGLATAALLGIGGLAATSILGAIGPQLGSVLTKAGNFITDKVPVSRFTGWIHRPAQALKNAGEKLTQRAYGSQAKLAEAKMNLYLDRLEKTTNPQQIADLTRNIANLAQRFSTNPYILNKLNANLSQMSQKDFEKIATNPQALSQLQSANLDQSTIDTLKTKIENLSTKAKRQILSDPTLLNTFSGLQAQLKDTFIEGIKKMSSEDVIKQIAKGGAQAVNQIAQDQQLLNAVDKVTKNLFSAIQSGIIQNVATSLSKLDLDALENFDNIEFLVNQLNLNMNLDQVLTNALQINAITILKASLTSSTLKNRLKSIFPTVAAGLQSLDPNRQDPILDNLIIQALS